MSVRTLRLFMRFHALGWRLACARLQDYHLASLQLAIYYRDEALALSQSAGLPREGREDAEA